MIAFKNFEEILKLPSVVDKHRVWLKAYEGLYYSKGLEHKDLVNWQREKEKYIYSDKGFDTGINKIQRLPCRVCIELEDGTEEDYSKLKEFFEKKNWGYIVSSHNGKKNYIWVEFNRDLSDSEARAFLKWVCPKGKTIDFNFANSNYRLPVLFAIHWKYSYEREKPIEYNTGEQIDYDALDLKPLKLKTDKKNKTGNFEYQTYKKKMSFDIDKEIDRLIRGEKKVFSLKEEDKIKPSKELFSEMKQILKKYIDTSEMNYNLLTIWGLGTYFHSQMETFPLLIFLARKRCGKTRTSKLLSALSYGSDGSVSTSVTEAFLFRHKEGTVFFDEMESISSKDKTTLREIINSVYKRGNKIIRYIERKVDGEKRYVEDIFYPFYPLSLANIYGFNDILEDRAIQIILQRSSKKQTKLIEDFTSNPDIITLTKKLKRLDTKLPSGLFTKWNSYIEKGEVEPELKDFFNSINKTGLVGRPFEIFLPLFLVAKQFNVLDLILNCAGEYISLQEGESIDNPDDVVQSFIEAKKYLGFVPISSLLRDFKEYVEEPEDWMNSKWFGRTLKRLGVVQEKRRINGKVQVILNYNSTNTTNSINTTNTTNSTKDVALVDLVDFVDKRELVDKDEKLNISYEKISENTKK